MSAPASPLPTNAIAISDLRDDQADVINRVAYRHERFVLTKHGRPVAALIPLDDMKLLEALEDRVDLESIAEARNDPENAGEPVAWEDVKRSAGL
jgi:prevent-host-death family protein